MAIINKDLPISDRVGQDFEDEHDILTFRPNINFIEPDQKPTSQLPDANVEEPQTIDDLRKRTEDVINQYKMVKKLAEQARRRIDQRVSASGGISIKLDPSKDSHVIAAMKREFPNKKDPTIIDYEDYKQCLQHQSENAMSAPSVSDQDIIEARSDPLRTNFGGLNNQQGENRPEINSIAGGIQPLDLGAFQAAGVLAVFLMMLPMIMQQDDLRIIRHLIETPHRPV